MYNGLIKKCALYLPDRGIVDSVLGNERSLNAEFSVDKCRRLVVCASAAYDAFFREMEEPCSKEADKQFTLRSAHIEIASRENDGRIKLDPSSISQLILNERFSWKNWYKIYNLESRVCVFPATDRIIIVREEDARYLTNQSTVNNSESCPTSNNPNRAPASNHP